MKDYTKWDYLFRLPIGDWSDDGHGKCRWYTCKSNKPIEKIREAHFNILSYTGIHIENICGEYADNQIDIETYEYLKDLGFDLSPEDEDLYLSPDDMAKVWIFLLKETDCDLEIEILDDEVIPMLPFYGFDDKKRHIGHVGYGVF